MKVVVLWSYVIQSARKQGALRIEGEKLCNRSNDLILQQRRLTVESEHLQAQGMKLLADADAEEKSLKELVGKADVVRVPQLEGV